MADVPGSSGFQIASAFVQVDPDAADFQGKLDAELGGVNYVVTVPVQPDTAGFTQQVETETAKSGATVSVPVVPDTAGFAATVDAEVAKAHTTVTVPVEPDAAGFGQKVETMVADTGAKAIVPVEPDAAGFAEKVQAAVADTGAKAVVPVEPGLTGFTEKIQAEADAAGAASGLSFGEKFSNVAASTPLFAAAASKIEAEAATAGDVSGATFSEKLAACFAAVPRVIWPEIEAGAGPAGTTAGTVFGERFAAASKPGMAASTAGGLGAAVTESEVAGTAAGGGFGSRFKARVAESGLLSSVIPGLEAESAAAGAKSGTGFMDSMKSTFMGDSPLMAAALGGAFVAATATMAAHFQSAMERIHTQAGVAQSAIGGLSSQVLDLAAKVGESPGNLAQALYHVESSFASVGITGSKAMDLLKIASEGARIGGANLVDVTNALDATIASGIGGVHSYSQAMGALNAIVGAGDMTMQNLAEAMGSGLMAVAKSYGQNIQEIGAALATFGDNNIRGAKAATDLRMAMQAILAPVKTGESYLNNIGLTLTSLGDTMRHHGLAAALQEFVSHLDAAKVPMNEWGQYVTNIFGKKAGAGIGVLIDQLGRMQSKFPDIQKGAAQFGNAWAHTQATVSQKLADLRAGFDAIMIKIGNGLLPVIGALAGQILKVLPTVEHFGKSLLHLASPVVKDFFLGFHTILTLLFGPLKTVTLAVTGLAIAFGVLSALNPYVAIGIAIITLVGVIVKYHKQILSVITGTWDKITDFMKTWWPAFLIAATGGLGLIVAVIIKYHKQIFGAFAAIWHGIEKPVVDAFENVKNSITNGFDSWWKSHGQMIKDVWHAIWAPLSTIFKADWGLFSAEAKNAWSLVITVFKTTWDVISGVFKVAWDVIATGLKVWLAGISAVWKTAWDVISAVLKVVWDTMAMILKTAWDVLVAAFSVFLDLITGHWKQAWIDIQTLLTQVWNNIKSYFGAVWNAITSLFKQELNIVSSTLTTAWNDIKSGVVSTWNAIAGVFKSFWSGLKSGFNDAVTAVKSIWHTLENAVRTPVSFIVNTVYDKGIVPIVNAVGSLIGLHLNPVSFATGGKVTAGTGPTSDDVLARVSKGETVVSAAHSQVLAPAFSAVGVPGYAAGGIPNPLGAIGHGITSALGDIGHALASLTGDALAAAASHILLPMLNLIPTGGTVIGADVKKIPVAIVEKLIAKLKGTSPAGGGPAPMPGGGDPAKNAALAQRMMPSWASGEQWTAWNNVAMRESGWSNTASNASSGAYGIPQALPYSKMPKGAWPASAGGSSNPGDQISWMVGYIQARYGTPAGAWAHETKYGWYDDGGWLAPGVGPANGTGSPEAVLTPQESAAFVALVKGLVGAGGVMRSAGTSGGGGAAGSAVHVNYYGTQMPTPEQEQAMLLKLASVIGVA